MFFKKINKNTTHTHPAYRTNVIIRKAWEQCHVAVVFWKSPQEVLLSIMCNSTPVRPYCCSVGSRPCRRKQSAGFKCLKRSSAAVRHSAPAGKTNIRNGWMWAILGEQKHAFTVCLVVFLRRVAVLLLEVAFLICWLRLLPARWIATYS